MRIAIVGAGGVGGYIGVRMAQAGHDVSYLVRGRTLETMKSQGIRLESPQGDVILQAPRASSAASDLGPQDAVIVTVKLYDLEAVAPSLLPLLGPDTLVLPLQNGVEANDILAHVLPAANVMKGTVSIKSYLLGPAHILCKSPFCRIKFAHGDGSSSDRAVALAAALNQGIGMEVAVSDDMARDLWLKFIMLVGFSAVCCLNRANIGQIAGSPEARALVLDAVEEAAAVGRALGVRLPADIEPIIAQQYIDMPKDGRPSMLEDLDAGNRIELPWLSGAVVRLGQQVGIATPLHLTAYRALALHAQGRAA